MKRIFNKIGSCAVIATLLLGSCETVELDITENPNQLSLDQSSPDLLLNSIQVDFATFVELMGQNGGDLVRIGYLNGRNYQNIANLSPANLNLEWNIAYQGDNGESLPSGLEVNGILADIRALAPAAVENQLFRHTAISQFIEAYTIVTLVDFFGDVPYSEAIQASAETPILNPNVDPGASIYDAALALLDTAIANFQSDVVAEPQNDFYYGGNWDNWVKACNTLKMKIYLQRRLVDSGAVASFNAIVAGGDFIDDTSEDLQFQWGTNSILPDARHPRYADNYTPSGGADYLPNWLMNLMNNADDPRIRYYFFRQVNAVPGEEIPPNEETIACSLEPVPQHYTDGGFTFCTLPNGYWGRDHGQNAGIPPDGFLRAIYGVYPSGGIFDDSRFEGLAVGDGGGGAGVTPILLASSVDFMQAEIAMLADPASGEPFILAGLAKSVAKVQSFGSLDASADLSFAPTAGQVTNHSNDVSAAFTGADDNGKWDILAEQFLVSLFGNGIDGYNFYRRTGFPTTFQPNLEPQPGAYIRSLNYPADFVNNNSSVDPKPNQEVQVFWDTNPSSPTFPIAN
ncbi:SusD/RagB family nutrient-binding outer membrane lipoprotein [Flagellimonas allohymeniacidonis]|uniref:SusD/RagB family nutrient-binding outer membrane lipoprotein n=1 Tax=Flagellimonas allohymeniacidonis TaxID=2517819 RepID=A0A4Q8QGR0_9FLAO|nr:SusD/RagB family nutrient-binding outer membrane lipoprotein [Allomuricauda hymeniacidonis]TAI49681.1 SusD/RagB family nutrient-binding outer membrane lipoprotein [Allomuricauda hymeniacidonis]